MSQIEKSNPIHDIESKKKIFRNTVANEINKYSKESRPIINLRKKIFQQCIYDKKEKVIMLPKDTLNHFKSKDSKNKFVSRSANNSVINTLPEGKWAKFKINTFIERVIDEKLENEEKENLIKNIESITSAELTWKIATPEETRYAYNTIHSCMRGNSYIVDFYHSNPDLFLVLVAYRGPKIVGRCVCLKHYAKPYIVPVRIYQTTNITHTHTEWLSSLQASLAVFGYKILPSMILFTKQEGGGLSWNTVCYRNLLYARSRIISDKPELWESIDYINYIPLTDFTPPHPSIYTDFILGMPSFLPMRNSRVTTETAADTFLWNNAFTLFRVYSNCEIKKWFSDIRNLENQIKYLKDLEQHPVVQEFYLNNGVVDEKANVAEQHFRNREPESSNGRADSKSKGDGFVDFVERVRAERASESASSQG